MQLGTAWIDVTPTKPIPIMGQLGERLGNFTHDPITVNAAVFKSQGTCVALISCDVALLDNAFVVRAQLACQARTAIEPANVIIAATHTHLAPYTIDMIFGTPDASFMDTLLDAIVAATQQAMADLEDVELYAGKGWLDQMGFNRRGVRTNGKVDMYHGSWNDDFAGVEGPRDGEVGVIFAKRPSGSIKAVIPSFSTHPNSVELEHYYSADIVGSLRMFLRLNLSEDVGVVYLTGAAGNTAPSQLENNKQALQPWRGEDGWKRSGMYLGSEILKIIAGTTTPMTDQSLAIVHKTVAIPMRQWPEGLDPRTWPQGARREYYERAMNLWPEMLKNENPLPVRLNVVRIGDVAICTNPAELFVEFGLAIKQSSPARITIISSLTDGYCGYVPIEQAFVNGGYCTLPAPTSRLCPSAGDTIVDCTRQLLTQAFAQGKS